MKSTEEWLEQNKKRALRYNTMTAYHEAGYVVAANHLGVRVRGATMLPALGSWGLARVGTRFTEDELSDCFWRATAGRPALARTRSKIEADVMTTMAGYMAEERALALGLAQLPEPPSDLGERRLDEREARLEKIFRESAARDAGLDGISDKRKVEFLLKEVTAHGHEARAYEAWLVERTHNLVRHEGVWRPTGRRWPQEVHVVAGATDL